MPAGLPRLLILGAHPDDAEFHAGGLASVHRELGHVVKMVSLTNGAAGHHERPPDEVAEMRRREAAAAGRVLGAIYEVWDIPDGELMPTLDLRRRVVREIRTFAPDLVLTHRPCDYHPDHRAAGQVVQDATYLVTVPNFLPQIPALFREPVVAYMPDLFRRPSPMIADVVLDVTKRVDTIVAMLACQRSQVFEWLPYQEGILDTIPDDEAAKLVWLRQWYRKHMLPRAEHFRQDLIAAYGQQQGQRIEWVEVYEISDYAASADDAARSRLFPGAHCRPPRQTAAATPSQECGSSS
ncbi:MAG: PIG-L family deacetylase [Pirellulales bacterium]|nr:PIG-L family deacetylase [Pirellulales bacterium]